MINNLVKIYGSEKVSETLKMYNQPSLDYYNHLSSPNAISKFTYQFMDEFGKITPEGVKLACAAIKEKKDYSFSPVVCCSDEDRDRLCQIICENPKCTPPPITFIMFESNHWVSGQICNDSNGVPNILLIDSIGNDLKHSEGLIHCPEIIKTFFNHFERANIFFSQEVRQRSGKGCSVFAIDDARHLQTTTRYLPDEYKDSGLFGYVQDKSTQDGVYFLVKKNAITLKPGQEIHLCNLPPHLKRTMQSRELLKDLGESPVNKRRETELKSASKYFKQKLQSDIKENKRIEYKFDKMREQNLSYMMGHTDEECKLAMNYFSVDTFEKRLSKESFSPRPKNVF